MIFYSSGQLRSELFNEIGSIHREVADIRGKQNVTKPIDKEKMDYPVMIIGCEYNRHCSV